MTIYLCIKTRYMCIFLFTNKVNLNGNSSTVLFPDHHGTIIRLTVRTL